jgi:hypothetical protein
MAPLLAGSNWMARIGRLELAGSVLDQRIGLRTLMRGKARKFKVNVNNFVLLINSGFYLRLLPFAY